MTTALDILAANGIKLTDEDISHYGVKGMKWGTTRKDTNGDGLVDPLAGGGDMNGEYDPFADVKTLADLKPSISELAGANGGIYNPKHQDLAVRFFPVVQFVNKLFGDKRSAPVRNIDFYVKSQRFLKGLFGQK